MGSPAGIPFSLSQLLGVEHAVDRLHLDDVEDYRRYADSLLVDGGSTAH